MERNDENCSSLPKNNKKLTKTPYFNLTVFRLTHLLNQKVIRPITSKWILLSILLSAPRGQVAPSFGCLKSVKFRERGIEARLSGAVDGIDLGRSRWKGRRFGPIEQTSGTLHFSTAIRLGVCSLRWPRSCLVLFYFLRSISFYAILLLARARERFVAHCFSFFSICFFFSSSFLSFSKIRHHRPHDDEFCINSLGTSWPYGVGGVDRYVLHFLVAGTRQIQFHRAVTPTPS